MGENIIASILGLAFLGYVGVTGVHSVADGLESQANQVSHCIDQANSKYSGC